ncbi:MAG: 23S rRNA (pseudouridine(1915)-N(3))-methyltransferase RlmH [Sulfuricurvum sp.]|uniref:23S rRNA (pseudouridine(1915)-N(3))-methyltransferase RlmH n=1 Tax=Sulfuricurvum sp. TaxID=2025608 RepID=UPI0026193A14|nr:23S rRNA (pseudouridine(1915)-N(3))-methyltransferase RlmH [Sulfuricurvum sp.]MDD2368207.1 23S rRNA (pseudouridine(1915)-N(3))-methyltransferase RlmH [Sulfuricurvum sp.]MDD5119387.1 23S rRNA (pseudouridine(1915)-N(3))-methyltransferase RlmH [Sulfuricurvum sp.]
MNISIVTIAKKERSLYDPLYQEQMKMISRFAKVDDVELFPKEIIKAHTISSEASQAAYSKLLSPMLGKNYSIALHPDGKKMDSFAFSKLISDKISLQFFIGGAYGFEKSFVDQCDTAISLSEMTMSHKIAKAVLLEQIYRAYSLLANHPYHK